LRQSKNIAEKQAEKVSQCKLMNDKRPFMPLESLNSKWHVG